MRIAVIGAKGLPAGQGGIERYCEELYPRLAAKGYSIDFYARPSYTESSWLKTYQFKGVRVICLPSLPWRGLDALTSSAIGAIATCFKPYDIVHFHALGPALFCAIPRLFSSAGIVVTCQGLDWQRAKWGKLGSGSIRLGEWSAVKFAHKIVVVSNALGSYFQKTYDLETRYIPNAPGKLPEPEPDFSKGRSLGLEKGRYCLFLGRLVPEKRPDLLLSAFQALQPKGWKLVFVGGDSDTPDYAAELARLAAENTNIRFTGELRGKHLSEIVSGAGLFVLPSDLEGLPLVMLEAMQSGVPVLASDILPHRQLIGADRGTLFRAGDVEDCTQQLRWAIQNPEALQVAAQKARAHVQRHYNWANIVADNLSLYNQVLAKRFSPQSLQIQLSEGESTSMLELTPDKEEQLRAYLADILDLFSEDLQSEDFPEPQPIEPQLRQEILDRIALQFDDLVSSRR
jgi:glycosyltransferase involved in cell wall biosynthesis